MKQVKVAIIGAGTAGLSARREVAKVTDDYVVIDDGPLGTTCARVGCMPSKVLIQVANDFHRRHAFAREGIHGADALSVDTREVMAHVRTLRDRFLRAIMLDMAEWRSEHLVAKRARLVSLDTIDLGDETIRAERIVLATGSRPIVPKAWQPFAKYLIDTDSFFDLDELPRSIAVVGHGVIGLELGQALARLGVEVHGITLDRALGGLTDPEIQDYAFQKFAEEFPITLGAADQLEERDGRLVIRAGGQEIVVDRVFVTMGRRPNIDQLGLEELDLPLDQRGVPIYHPGTYRIADTPLFLVGDANSDRPILHEAADEGRIAGYNAVRETDQCFQRRVKLGITFSSPNIATVGESWKALTERGANFVTGKVSFEGQGRAIVKLAETGQLHVYADRVSGKLLGAELFAPEGEHLAHLLAWAIAADFDALRALAMPFYHPVLEEGLRTALRAAVSQVERERGALEVMRCQDPPVGSWS